MPRRLLFAAHQPSGQVEMTDFTRPAGRRARDYLPHAATMCVLVILFGCGRTGTLWRGKPIEYWIAEWKSAEGTRRVEAMQALIEAGPLAVPALVEALPDTATVLGELPPRAAPALAEALKRTPKTHRITVAHVLARIDPENEDAVATLMQGLQDTDAKIRVHSAFVVGDLRMKTAVPLLAKMAANDDGMRGAAMIALAKLGPDAEEAIPVLVTWLDSHRAGHRMLAAQTLGKIGPAARVAIPALTETVKDSDWKVVIWTAYALCMIHPEDEQWLSTLTDFLEPDNRDIIRAEAATAIAEMDVLPETAMPAVVEALHDEDVDVRLMVVKAIERVSPERRTEAAAALKAALNDKTDPVRAAAADALKNIQDR